MAIGRQWRQGLPGTRPSRCRSSRCRFVTNWRRTRLWSQSPGSSDARLPNLEDPKRPVSSPGMQTEPAGFGPIPRTWEQRTSRSGSYDAAWLKQRWPWFPNDFDWAHFNAAPRDQQLDGYLDGDEPLELENLHPDYSRYETRLPGIRPQLFVVDGYGTREAALKLDTLWVDADAEKLVLLWRGSLPIQSIRMADLREVHVVQTPLEKRPTTWADVVRAADFEKAATMRARAEEQVKEAADTSAVDATSLASKKAAAVRAPEGTSTRPSRCPVNLALI